MSNCKICKGTGKIHPALPNGKVDWSRLVYCDCTGKAGKIASEPLDLEQPEHYVRDNSGLPMFDFPCSYLYRRYEAEVFDNVKLPDIEIKDLPQVDENTPRLVQRHQSKIQEHEGQLIHIRQALTEHMKAGKKRREDRY